jgi:hypothetical protein
MPLVQKKDELLIKKWLAFPKRFALVGQPTATHSTDNDDNNNSNKI